MNANKISILFLLSKTKRNVKGQCPVKCRITFLKKRKEFSTGLFIEDENWNNKIQLAIGNNADYINSNLALIKQKLEQIQLEYSVLKSTYTVEDIFLKYIGKDTVEQMTLLKMFQFHIDRMKELVGIDFKPVTVQKYELIKTHVKSFIQWKYGKNDILLEQLKLNFLTEFEFYLKTKQKQKQTTINKAIQRVRTVVKTAIGEEYLSVDPFVLFKPKKSEYSLVFLSKQELKKLEEYQFRQKRLEQVKDCYVFCCYTGLAYLEMVHLKKDNIITGFDGNLWISMHRQKTGKDLMVPLLPQAKAILDKQDSEQEEALPKISNQKFNSYLKEIAEIVGIKKTLTHHTARKTFASTVLLYNNVPIEIVSKLLGHSKVTMTQEHYGKVVNQRVSEEIQKLIGR